LDMKKKTGGKALAYPRFVGVVSIGPNSWWAVWYRPYFAGTMSMNPIIISCQV
jgi:hypothetical protein